MKLKIHEYLAKYLPLAAGLFALIAFSAVEAVAPDAEAQSAIAIVVHKDAPVDDLSLQELRNIFLANQQFWSNRARIILLLRAPQSDERDFVLNRIY